MFNKPENDRACSSTCKKILNKVKSFFEVSVHLNNPWNARTGNPTPTASPRLSSIVSTGSDEWRDTPYCHNQDNHGQRLLREAISSNGRCRLKEREQILIIEEGVSIRDFAFEVTKQGTEIEGERQNRFCRTSEDNREVGESFKMA